jgi:hypothetical protein
VKLTGRNPDHREGLLIQIDPLANDVRVAVEPCVPEVITQNNVRGRIDAMLVAQMEEPAQGGLHSQRVEIIAGGKLAEIPGRGSSSRDGRLGRVVGSHFAEGTVALAIVEVVRIRLVVAAVLSHA